jgi:hypothetical protein
VLAARHQEALRELFLLETIGPHADYPLEQERPNDAAVSRALATVDAHVQARTLPAAYAD